MPSDPLDLIFGGDKTKAGPAAPATPAPTQQQSTGDPLDQIFGGRPSGVQPVSPAATAGQGPLKTTPGTTGDPLDGIFGPAPGTHMGPRGSDFTPSVSPATPSSEDEYERMGGGQSWYNRPLTTSLGIPEYRQGAGGVERALEKFASGLSSPLNLGLMLVTGGVGGLAEAGAVTAGEVAASEGLSMFGKAAAPLIERLGPEVAAKVATAAGTVSKMANAGFTLQQLAGLTDTVPQLGDAIKAGDYDKALEMATSSALSVVAAGLSGHHLVKTMGGLSTEPTWTGDKDVLAAEKHELTRYGQKANDFGVANKELISNGPLDISARLYHEAGGDISMLERWRNDIANDKNIRPEIRAKWAGLLGEAQKLPDEVKAVSLKLKEDYASDWERLNTLGVAKSEEGHANYSGTHTYEADDEGGSTLRNVARRLTKKPSFLKSASFENTVEALKAGYEPKEVGLAAARHDYILDYGNREAAAAAEKTLTEQAGKDGRPGAVWGIRRLGSRRIAAVSKNADLSGFAEPRVPVLDDQGNEVSDQKVRGLATMPSDQDLFQQAIQKHLPGNSGEGRQLADLSKDERRLVALGVERDKAAAKTAISEKPTAVRRPIIEPDQQGRLVVYKGNYYYDVSDYKQGPDLFRRNRLREITPGGEEVFDNVAPLVHPDLADPINQAYNDHSWFQKNPLLSTVLSASSQAKRSLLAWSPFHWTTEYWRGIQMGLNPHEALMPQRLTEESLAVKSKFPPTLSTARERSLAQEGLASGSSLIEKVPILGDAQKALDHGLFGPNGYIDRLKGATFEKVVKQLSKRHSNWTEDQIHYSASRTVDAAFGGLDWRMLGASANTRDFLRMVMLAPDFTGSQVMFGGLGFQAGGSVVAHSLARIAAVNFGVAQVLNMLVGGKVRLDHLFSVVSPDGKKLYNIRTMPGDLAHMLTDPRQFAYNRMSPALRIGTELLTGRDEQGKRITAERQLHEMLRNVLPIPSQSALPGFRREGEAWYESALRAGGFAVQPEVSYALGKARLLASDHSPSGPVNTDRLAQHRTVINLESGLRDRKIDTTGVSQMVAAGRISQEDRKNILKNYRDTQHMTDELADLYSKASHLPMNEFLDVYGVATPEEKAALHRLLLDKEHKFMQEHVRTDPTYQRLISMFPRQAPGGAPGGTM